MHSVKPYQGTTLRTNIVALLGCIELKYLFEASEYEESQYEAYKRKNRYRAYPLIQRRSLLVIQFAVEGM